MSLTGIGPLAKSVSEGAATAKLPGKPLLHAFSQALTEAEQVLKGAPAGVKTPLRLNYGTGGPLTIADLRRDMETMRQALSIELTRALAEAGVQVPPEVTLSVTPDGAVTANGHPDRRAIATYFQAHPDMQGQVRSLQASAQWLKDAEDALAFQEAYRVNPDLAVSRFAHLLDGHSQGNRVSLLITEQGDLTLV